MRALMILLLLLLGLALVLAVLGSLYTSRRVPVRRIGGVGDFLAVAGAAVVALDLVCLLVVLR